MTVELKRTKITKSIVSQCLSGSYELIYNNEGYDILGWCLVKNIRKVLLFNKLSNQVITLNYTYLYEDRIRIIEESIQRDDKKGGYIFPTIKIIKIYYPDIKNTLSIQQKENETYEDMEIKLEKIKKFYLEVNQKGQIYL